MTQKRIDSLVVSMIDSRDYYGVSYVEHMRLYTLKEIGIIEIMSKLEDQSNQLLVGHFWCPESQKYTLNTRLDHLKQTASDFHGVIISNVKTTANPPTCFRTNAIMEPFQQIVNTYGIPRYKELNPAPFSIATFPFLFGIMFGDIGHGSALMVATYFIFTIDKNSPKTTETMAGLAKNKYLFLLMSFFSIYCGFVYNDYLALPTRLVKSCYNEHIVDGNVRFARKFQCNTPFGIDPVWGKTKNEITYLNSFKMKMSIIIGVLQMMFGLFLKGANSFYFKDWMVLFLEFIPQVLFLGCSFGYMCVCIVAKWLRDWSHVPKPPMIINTFINFLNDSSTPIFEDGDAQLILQKNLGCTHI